MAFNLFADLEKLGQKVWSEFTSHQAVIKSVLGEAATVTATVAAGTAAPGAKLVTVYVATTRVREPDSDIVYTSGRAPQLNYAEFTIAIPPHHKPGTIEWPTGTPIRRPISSPCGSGF